MMISWPTTIALRLGLWVTVLFVLLGANEALDRPINLRITNVRADECPGGTIMSSKYFNLPSSNFNSPPSTHQKYLTRHRLNQLTGPGAQTLAQSALGSKNI